MGKFQDIIHFAVIDWFWLIAFILLMVIFGIYFYRLGKRSQSDFFLAGRGLPWWLPASSVYATHTATDTPIWVTGVIYKYGLTGLWYVSTRIFRRSLAYSQAEWQTLRFGGLGAEMIRGWLAGWQVFMNMFVLGWVGIAMGKLCHMLFGWDLWMGLVLFTGLSAVYVLMSGYWGVVMADFQQGVIAFLLIVLVSIWGMLAAGGPQNIINKLKQYNSTVEWELPRDIAAGSQGLIQISDARSGGILAQSLQPFIIQGYGERAPATPRLRQLIQEGRVPEKLTRLLFPGDRDTLVAGTAYPVVWTQGTQRRLVNISYSLDGGTHWNCIAEHHFDGQAWRINPLSFTGWTKGQFPIAWFITMLVIALIGGFGMGTSIDWYPEAQRIQSAKSVRDASYSIWAGSAMVLLRNSIWAAAILGFFVLFPHLAKSSQYEMGWYVLGFRYLPVGLVGFFFAGILAIHFSTVSTHLNLGAMYATRDFFHHYVRPQASEVTLVKVGRISTIVILLGSFIFGTIIGEEITQWLIFALWIMMAGVWLPNILQVIWWRFNAWGYLSAWIANLGLSWLVVWVLPRFGVIPALPDYLQFWALIVLNALVYLPVTLCSRPENMDHLVKYYVMCRPIGFWRPVRREAMRRGLLTSE
jgi:Na+/proline symporter